MVLVFLGKTHNSSAVHEQVIAGLKREGDASPRLEALRHTAERHVMLSTPETSRPSVVRRSLLRTIDQANPLFEPILIYISRFGMRVWEGLTGASR